MTTDQEIEVPAFRQDRLARAWLGLKAVSDAGDALWTIALAWTAVQIASPAAAGAVVAAGAIPRAITLLLGGAMADRYDALRVMTIANLVRIGVLVGVVVWVAARVADAWWCSWWPRSRSGSATRSTNRPPGPSADSWCGPSDLAAYGGLGQTLTRIGTMVGSAAGGVVVAAWGLGGSAALNAVTFGVRGAVPGAEAAGALPAAPLRARAGAAERAQGLRLPRLGTRPRARWWCR